MLLASAQSVRVDRLRVLDGSCPRPDRICFQIPMQLFARLRPVFAVYFSVFHQSHDSCSLRSVAGGLARLLVKTTCYSSTHRELAEAKKNITVWFR